MKMDQTPASDRPLAGQVPSLLHQVHPAGGHQAAVRGCPPYCTAVWVGAGYGPELPVAVPGQTCMTDCLTYLHVSDRISSYICASVASPFHCLVSRPDKLEFSLVQ